jgi:hypothetical protein
MCWVALDRAIALADLLHASDRVDRWMQQREEIRDAVVRDAWSEEAGAFTQYVGSTTLDASALMMAIVGFLPANDPRMLATIDAIEKRLTDDRGLVYRYRTEEGVDGLAGEEGTFLLCTFSLRRSRSQIKLIVPGRCLSGPLHLPTISACWRRKLTRIPVNCLATFRKHLATLAWLTPHGQSPKPNAEPDLDHVSPLPDAYCGVAETCR